MSRPTRRAFTIIEVTAAAAMLVVALSTFVPMLHLVQTQRRENAMHRDALMTADNLLERVLALDWSDMQSDVPGDAIRADELLHTLPGGRWSLEVTEIAAAVPAKRVTVAVTYGTRVRTATVHMTAWAYKVPQEGRGS